MARHSLSYRHTLHSALKTLLEDNGREDLAARIPKLASNQPREVTVPEAEFERVLRVAPPALELALLLAHEAGLRAMTACKLNRANVDFDARRIHGETKGGSKYDVPMTQRLHDRLLWYCAAAQDADEPLTSVFRPHRKPFTSPALHTAMTDARKRAGVTSHWGLHDLRRTAARNLYEHTKDLRKTQALLGHRTLWTTVWYLGNAATTLTAEDLEASTTNTNPKTERKHA